jgi:hypothetical protein
MNIPINATIERETNEKLTINQYNNFRWISFQGKSNADKIGYHKYTGRRTAAVNGQIFMIVTIKKTHQKYKGASAAHLH